MQYPLRTRKKTSPAATVGIFAALGCIVPVVLIVLFFAIYSSAPHGRHYKEPGPHTLALEQQMRVYDLHSTQLFVARFGEAQNPVPLRMLNADYISGSYPCDDGEVRVEFSPALGIVARIDAYGLPTD